MLKPPGQHPPSEPDPSIGDLVERLLDDAREYGHAELELLKARAREIAANYARAAILFGIAAVVALSGIVTLFVGIALALARWIGPLAGALVSASLAAGVAALLAWVGVRDLKEGQ